jgi:hypothetical protein
VQSEQDCSKNRPSKEEKARIDPIWNDEQEYSKRKRSHEGISNQVQVALPEPPVLTPKLQDCVLSHRS